MSINGAINIINGFSVGAPYPIDYRMVMPNAAERIAIIHKYDGLRVFQTDTRETWTWNAISSTWESESSGSIGGGGSASYVPRWNNSQTLENSNLYNISNKIGLNTTDPQGIFHLINPTYGTSSGLVIDVDSSTSFFGLNSYNSISGPVAFDVTKGSSNIVFKNTGTNTSNIIFNIRRPNDNINTNQDRINIGYKDSLNQYSNLIDSFGNQNYIVGSMSISNNRNTVDNNPDLLLVNGSMRTYGKMSKRGSVLNLIYTGTYRFEVLDLDVGGATSLYQNGNITYAFNSPNSIFNPAAGTYQMTEDHEIIVNNYTSGPLTKPIIIYLPQSPTPGREIIINYVIGVANTNINGINIKKLDGTTTTNFNITPGERTKLIYLGGNNQFWQVVEIVSNTQLVKNSINSISSTLQAISSYSNVYYRNSFYSSVGSSQNNISAFGGASLSGNFSILQFPGPNNSNRFNNNNYNHIHYINIESLYGVGNYNIEMTFNMRVRLSNANANWDRMNGSIYMDTVNISNISNSSTISNNPWYNIRNGFNHIPLSTHIPDNEVIWGGSNGTEEETNFTMTYAVGNISIDSSKNCIRFIVDGFMSDSSSQPLGAITIQNSSILWKIIKEI
jgi:hypothetical protein